MECLMPSFLKTTALAAAFVAGTAVSAHAVTFANGSLAIGAFTDTTTALASTTVFHLNPATFTLASGAGDFTGLSAPAVPVATNLDLSNGASFDFSDPTIGSFAANPGAVLILPSAPGVLSFFVGGTYTVGSAFSNAGSTLTANETFSFTQTAGAGNSISISGTFFSPLVPPPSVPEPASMALIGSGLIALAGVARRKRR